jgi:hypothetical protein
MDADDVMRPDRLEKQYQLLRNCDSTTVAGSGAYSIDASSGVVGIRPLPAAAAGSFIHPTVAASSEWFRRYRYSESFIFHRSQDAELWFRSAPESRFLTIREPLLFYREAGTFTLDKYIGTKLGMISLAARLSGRSRSAAVRALTLEVAKLWIMSLADVFGCAGRIVAHRYKRLSPAGLAEAETILGDIAAIPLPCFEPQAARPLELSGCAR